MPIPSKTADPPTLECGGSRSLSRRCCLICSNLSHLLVDRSLVDPPPHPPPPPPPCRHQRPDQLPRINTYPQPRAFTAWTKPGHGKIRAISAPPPPRPPLFVIRPTPRLCARPDQRYPPRGSAVQFRVLAYHAITTALPATPRSLQHDANANPAARLFTTPHNPPPSVHSGAYTP